MAIDEKFERCQWRFTRSKVTPSSRSTQPGTEVPCIFLGLLNSHPSLCPFAHHFLALTSLSVDRSGVFLDPLRRLHCRSLVFLSYTTLQYFQASGCVSDPHRSSYLRHTTGGKSSAERQQRERSSVPQSDRASSCLVIEYRTPLTFSEGGKGDSVDDRSLVASDHTLLHHCGRQETPFTQ